MCMVSDLGRHGTAPLNLSTGKDATRRIITIDLHHPGLDTPLEQVELLRHHRQQIFFATSRHSQPPRLFTSPSTMARKAVFAAYASVTILSCGSLAFVVPLQSRSSLIGIGQSSAVCNHVPRHSRRLTRCRMEVEELEQTVDHVKAKRLDIVDEAQGICSYEFEIEATGSMTNRLNHRIKRAVSEKANFPGHDKGDIPRQVMPEVNKFVVEEVINASIVEALEAYGLVGAEGEGTSADLNTDIKDLLEIFKPGKTLPFMCTINAKTKPDGEGAAEAQDATLSDAE